MDETPLGIEMHCIEPNAVGAPCQPRAVETSFSGGGSAGGRSGTGSTDASAGRSDACTTTWGEQPTPAGTGSMLLNHAGAFAASSRASFVSDAATEVGEHHPHVSHLRDAISTAPTLHSRSSTPVVLADRDTDSGRTPCTGGGPHGNRNRFAVFWTQNISVHVPGSAARDHLAIERTFLAYHRTSLMFALTATLVAQLFVLNHKANPNPHFGFYVLGKPLAVTLVCLSLGLTLLGWWRWYNWQRNTVRGVCVVGGWELEGVLFVMMFFFFTIFGITFGIGVHKILS